MPSFRSFWRIRIVLGRGAAKLWHVIAQTLRLMPCCNYWPAFLSADSGLCSSACCISPIAGSEARMVWDDPGGHLELHGAALVLIHFFCGNTKSTGARRWLGADSFCAVHRSMG